MGRYPCRPYGSQRYETAVDANAAAKRFTQRLKDTGDRSGDTFKVQKEGYKEYIVVKCSDI